MKKKKILGFLLVLIVVMLTACSNNLKLNLDKSEVNSKENGTITIKGNVEGEGILYINDKKAKSQPHKDGSFKTEYKTSAYEDTTLKITYIDKDDKENQSSADLKVKANPKAVEAKKKELEEASEKAKAEQEEARKKANEEAELAKARAMEEEKKKAEEEAKAKADEENSKEDNINAAFQEIITVSEGYLVRIEPADSSKPLDERSYKAYISEDIKYVDENSKKQFIDNLARAIQSKVAEQTGEIPFLSVLYDQSGHTAAKSRILDPSVMKYVDD